MLEFSAYKLPVGTEFSLGKRRWRLVERMSEHPDWLTFREISPGASTPDRVMNPSEVEELHARGVVFMVPV